MSMRELERSVSEALVSAGDSAYLPGLASSESNRNSRANRDAFEVETGHGELARVQRERHVVRRAQAQRLPHERRLAHRRHRHEGR